MSRVKPPKAMKLHRFMSDSFTKDEYMEAGQLTENEIDQYLRWLIKFKKIERVNSGKFKKL